MWSMFKGFRDFITRGNVVDLAVGIVIGAAFTALVTQFTTSFLTPLIIAIGAGPNKDGGGMIHLPGTTPDGHPNGITYGAFISAIIAFLLTALVVYFLVVVPMNKYSEIRARRQEPPPPTPPTEEITLLREIRDALLAGRTPSPRRAEADGQHQDEPEKV
jgi:large conductance mechanosensitive channel